MNSKGNKGFFSSWKGWAITGGSAAVIAAAAFFFLSGSKAYMKVIPADAKIVMMVDPAAIVDKCNLSEHAIITDKIKEFAEHVPDEAGEILMKVVEDPSCLGIDVTKPAYFFVSGDALTGGKGGMVLAVKDKGTLKGSFEKLQEVVPSSEFELEEEDGYCWGMVEEKPLFAFDGDAFLIMGQVKPGRYGLDGDAATKAQFKALFDLDSDKQFTSTEAWNKMKSTEGEAQFFLSFGIVPQMALDMLKTQSGFDFEKEMGGLKLKDVNYLATMTFEKGQVSLIQEIFGADSESQKKLEAKGENFQKVGGKFLNMANDKTLAWASVNLGGIPLLNIVKASVGKETLIAGEQAANFDFSALLNALNGDFAFAFDGDINNLKEGNEDEEEFILNNFIIAADAAKTDFMNKFDEARFGDDVKITRTQGNVYVMDFKEKRYVYNWDSDYYDYTVDEYPEDGVYDDYDPDAIIEDSVVVWEDEQADEPNTETTTRSFFVGAEGNNLFFAGKNAFGPNRFKGENSRLAQHKDDITSSYGYFWVDLKKILKTSIEERDMQRLPAQAKKVINMLDEVIFFAEKPLKNKLSLCITEKDKNILDILCGLIAEVVEQNL